MTRRLFTIVAAHPVDIQEWELPRVELRTFIVEGDTLQAAFAAIKDWTHIVDATEVMGVELEKLCLTPESLLRREEQLGQWEHWSSFIADGENCERPWTHLMRGPESFRQQLERRFSERFPQFA